MTPKNSLILTAIACLVIGGLGGYFSRSLIGSGQPNGGPMGGNMPSGSSRSGAPADTSENRISGSIQSIADGRIIVTTQNNNSQIILVNSSTTYQKTANGALSDLTDGSQIMVVGEKNADGSTTATSVQIIPTDSDMPFGGNGPAN